MRTNVEVTPCAALRLIFNIKESGWHLVGLPGSGTKLPLELVVDGVGSGVLTLSADGTWKFELGIDLDRGEE